MKIWSCRCVPVTAKDSNDGQWQAMNGIHCHIVSTEDERVTPGPTMLRTRSSRHVTNTSARFPAYKSVACVCRSPFAEMAPAIYDVGPFRSRLKQSLSQYLSQCSQCRTCSCAYRILRNLSHSASFPLVYFFDLSRHGRHSAYTQFSTTMRRGQSLGTFVGLSQYQCSEVPPCISNQSLIDLNTGYFV